MFVLLKEFAAVGSGFKSLHAPSLRQTPQNHLNMMGCSCCRASRPVFAVKGITRIQKPKPFSPLERNLTAHIDPFQESL